MRPALAIVAGAVAAALGAVILGEYQLTGLTGVIAGALFGLAIAELVLTVAGSNWSGRENVGLVAVALLTAAGLVWACWISAGHLWRYVPKGAWTGVVVGAALGPWWLHSGVQRVTARESSDAT
jgi:hypothetical protein